MDGIGSFIQTVHTLPAGTAVQIVGRNHLRRFLGVQNIGTGHATIGFSASVTAANGWAIGAALVLGQQGGSLTLGVGEFIHHDPVWAISTAGTTLVVLEG